jgi:hypothetical protein
VTHLSAFVSIFPYDSTIDSVMGYHHLVIAYSLTWVVHLCYLGYVIHKRRSARSLDGK